MRNSTKLTGAVLATAAALLFTTVSVQAAESNDAKVKCEGVNECSGKSACGTATSACAGQNSCAGKGYLMLSKTDCDAAKAAKAAKGKSKS